jgi:hypothetical protein
MRSELARVLWRAYSAPQAGDHDDDGWVGGAEHYDAFWNMADAVMDHLDLAQEGGGG